MMNTKTAITMLYFKNVICKHFWLCINSFTVFFSIVLVVISCKLCETKVIYSRNRGWSNTVAFNDVGFEYLCTVIIQVIKFLFCLLSQSQQIMLQGKLSLAGVQAYRSF